MVGGGGVHGRKWYIMMPKLTVKRGREWTTNQIIRPEESLALYKSFNTVCGGGGGGMVASGT